MKIKSEIYKKAVSGMIIIFALSLVMLCAYLGGLFNFIEYKLYDLRVNIFAPMSNPSDDIILILLDQESINWAQRERGWGWPWPRSAYGEIIDFINFGGAKSIAFDVLFTEPSIYRNPRQDQIIAEALGNLESSGLSITEMVSILNELAAREDDAAFIRAAEEFERTVQIVMFSSQSGTTSFWPEDLDTSLFELNNFEQLRSEFEKLNQHVEQRRDIRALFPIEELKNAAGIIGNVTGWPDSDYIFRRSNLFSIFDGKAVPGLSAASLLVSGENHNIY